MSISIATMGKYWPQAGYGLEVPPGISGGGGFDQRERQKPVVKVSGIKYDKKKKENINISVIGVEYD